MKHKDFVRNIKLGGFVLGGIVLFLVAVFYLGKEDNVFNKTFNVSAVFRNVEGLKNGDNVWLSGVKIGTVREVKIVSEGQVVVVLSLKDKQNEFIKKDATAFIGSDGLVGNKIVVIRPGTDSRTIEDNDTINSLSPTDTQELLNLAKEVGTNTRSITDDLKLISQRLKNGEGIFGELLNDGPVSNDLRDGIAALKATGENAERLTQKTENILDNVSDGEGLITKLLTDTTYAATFEDALTSVGEVGANAKVISRELKALVSDLRNKDNAIGVLLSDSAFAHKLETTLDNAEAASAKLDENMEAMQHNFLLRGYFRKKKKEEEKNKKM